MPRRISDYPDAFAGWNLISSLGSIISVVATWLFLRLVNVQLVEGKATTRYPWLTPQFYGDLLQTFLNRSYNSLEWALTSPPKPHAFYSLPIQIALCIHGFLTTSFCMGCQALWNIRHANVIACTHDWSTFVTNVATPCNFGLPTHTIASHVLANTCSMCHAVACSGCIG